MKQKYPRYSRRKIMSYDSQHPEDTYEIEIPDKSPIVQLFAINHPYLFHELNKKIWQNYMPPRD